MTKNEPIKYELDEAYQNYYRNLKQIIDNN